MEHFPPLFYKLFVLPQRALTMYVYVHFLPLCVLRRTTCVW